MHEVEFGAAAFGAQFNLDGCRPGWHLDVGALPPEREDHASVGHDLEVVATYDVAVEMRPPAMVAVAALVFAEKVVPHGRAVGVVAAAAMIAYGLAVSLHPSFLPTVA